MNPSENNGDKLTPQTTFFTPATLFALLVIAAQILVTYPFLPAKVPTHWNAAGQAKWFIGIDRTGIYINPVLLRYAA